MFFLFPPHDSDAFQAFQMPSHTRTQSTSTEAKDMLKTRKRRHQRWEWGIRAMLQKRGSLVIFSFLSSAFGMDRHTVYGVNSVPFKNVATHTHTSVQILPHLVLHCPTQQMYVYVCKSTRVTRLHKLSATRKLHSHTHTHTYTPLSISTGAQDRALWK